MKSIKRRNFWIFALIVIFLLISYLIFLSSEQEAVKESKNANGSSTSIEIEDTNRETSVKERDQDPNQQERFLNAFGTPITFWGVVVDQDGAPVKAADIKFFATDVPWDLDGASSKYSSISNSSGLFSISGVKGASLGVSVSKEGFDSVKDSDGISTSNRLFDYSGGGALEDTLPSESEPAIFVLRRKLAAEQLYHINRDIYDFPTDLASLRIDLRTGESFLISEANDSQSTIEIRLWSSPEKRYGDGRNAPFDWGFEISSPGGGVKRRMDLNKITAPLNGYESKIMAEMLGDGANNVWTRAMSGIALWVKHQDETYSMVTIELRVGRKNVLYLESFHNPSGSQNLEFDPAKLEEL